MARGASSSSSAEDDGDEFEEVAHTMTEYEKQRLETIKQNRDVLANLQVKHLAKTIRPPPVVLPGKKMSIPESSGGRRRSRRISSIKSPKVVDWSSDSAEAADTFESDSDQPVFSSKPSGKMKRKTKKKISLAKWEDIEEKKNEDVEYEPSGSDTVDSAEEEETEKDSEEEIKRHPTPSRKKKTQAKKPRTRTLKSPVKRTMSLNSPSLAKKRPPQLLQSGDTDVDDDLALQQALALSLGSSLDMMPPRVNGETKGKNSIESPHGQIGSKGPQKRQNKRSKELLLKESEIDAFFVAIVGSHEGRLSTRHLEITASAHDFIWKEEELHDMIDIYDKDNDGQLNLAEFRSMAKLCKLMEGC